MVTKRRCIKEISRAILEAQKKKGGYEQVVTPYWSKELYVTSGHYAKYGADSFQPINTAEGEVLLKPMNCLITEF
jgi:threonyl-tRNA synthetase